MSLKGNIISLALIFVMLEGCAGGSPATSKPSNVVTPHANYSTSGVTPQATNSSSGSSDLVAARTKIKHIVLIMQENRSFDNYFGTYPGADGIPMKNGIPTVCVNDPKTNQCVKPYHDANDINAGSSHSQGSAVADINGGKMDGFLATFRKAQAACKKPDTPGCVIGAKPDVMGWHDAREIPNYWAYARNFVLQDHMFEPNASWSLPAHLFMVSAWSAKCSIHGDAMSCVNELENPKGFDWTDVTYILHKGKVTWGYYLSEGDEPDCEDDAMLCQSKKQTRDVYSIFNPLPAFYTVQKDNQLENIQTVDKFFTAAKDGTLPSVSWIVPNGAVSEHPPSKISDGQGYVTSLINAIMQGPDWSSTVILLAWDDWGGFYDNIVPPVVDENGYGLRVPALVISPFAKKGFIDHQTLSFDAYLKFIEDIFLNGQRLDPATDGRPDPRPTVRENVPLLGNILNDLDFSQTPLPPFILPIKPPPGPASIPGT